VDKCELEVEAVSDCSRSVTIFSQT
jgi:hypothetical protein